MEKKSKKQIWMIVFALLLAIAISVGIVVSELKKRMPTEGDEVISLLPEIDDDVDLNESSNDNSEGNDKVGNNTNDSKGRAEQTRSALMQRTLYAQMSTEDEEQAWGSTTLVDIFDEFYQNKEEDNSVENGGSDSMNLIAPGTEDSYTFWVKNSGEVSLDYKVWFEQIQTEGYDIPIEVRVKSGDAYVVGTEDTWVDIQVLDSFEESSKLKVKNYAQYTLEWRWPFEVDDDYDTYLGNEAVVKNIEQTIIIHTYGETTEGSAWGGLGIGGVQTGDSTMIIGWGALAVVMAVVIILLLREKKEEKERE